MAGIRGNQAWLMASRQAAKTTAPGTGIGTVAHPTLDVDDRPTVLPTVKQAFSGGTIGPTRETDRLSETDASRDQGDAYVTASGIEGTPEVYVRNETIGFWLAAVLGADAAAAGTPPAVNHVLTPADNLPYITVWRNVGNVLYERFEDCQVGSLTISADAGSPLTASIGIQGVRSTRLTADPSLADSDPGAPTVLEPLAVDNSTVFNFNDAKVELWDSVGNAWVQTRLVSSFELTIENNISRQQTDDVEPYDVAVGTREVSLGFDAIFENINQYNEFHYGAVNGTEISKDIFETKARFTFTKDADDNELVFELPRIAYEEYPVDPDPGGDPITVSVRTVAQRNNPVVQATVRNRVTAGYLS